MFQSIHNRINKQVKIGNKKRDNNERSVPQYSNTREEHLFACLEKNNYLLRSFFSESYFAGLPYCLSDKQLSLHNFNLLFLVKGLSN